MKICEAMMKSGITNPETQAGYDFCIEKCPYERCFVEESVRVAKRKLRKDTTESLRLQGLSIDEMAVKMGKCRRTVQRYLRY